MKEETERIICAAIYYDDGKNRSNLPHNIKSGIVAAGWRHHNCYTILWSLYPERDYIDDCIQGFLTSKGYFINREDGMKIAIAAGQVQFDNTTSKLYSEDIY